jgi:hypothetical protein
LEPITLDEFIDGCWGQRSMTTADEYRRYAADCMALANRLTHPNDKARLVQMAQAFLELADRREVLDPQPKRR